MNGRVVSAIASPSELRCCTEFGNSQLEAPLLETWPEFQPYMPLQLRMNRASDPLDGTRFNPPPGGDAGGPSASDEREDFSQNNDRTVAIDTLRAKKEGSTSPTHGGRAGATGTSTEYREMFGSNGSGSAVPPSSTTATSTSDEEQRRRNVIISSINRLLSMLCTYMQCYALICKL